MAHKHRWRVTSSGWQRRWRTGVDAGAGKCAALAGQGRATATARGSRKRCGVSGVRCHLCGWCAAAKNLCSTREMGDAAAAHKSSHQSLFPQMETEGFRHYRSRAHHEALHHTMVSLNLNLNFNFAGNGLPRGKHPLLIFWYSRLNFGFRISPRFSRDRCRSLYETFEMRNGNIKIWICAP